MMKTFHRTFSKINVQSLTVSRYQHCTSLYANRVDIVNTALIVKVRQYIFCSPNDRFIKEGKLCLFDMGANYFGYAADIITCTFPVSGKFTPDQKLIYKVNLAVTNTAKPGVNWVNMHLLANRVLLTELKKGGLLQGNVDEMIDAGLGHTFQPHGLRHLLGLDVHDVGGYLPDSPSRLQSPTGVHKLRTSRNFLEGMVVTIEPECYIVDPLLDGALEDFEVGASVQEIEDWLANKDDDKY